MTKGTLLIAFILLITHYKAQLNQFAISKISEKGGIAMTIPSKLHTAQKGEIVKLFTVMVYRFDDNNHDGVAQAWSKLVMHDNPELKWLSFNRDYFVDTLMAPPQLILRDIPTENQYFASVFADTRNLEVGQKYKFKVGACDEITGGFFGTRVCVFTAIDTLLILGDSSGIYYSNQSDMFHLVSPRNTVEEIPFESTPNPTFIWTKAFSSNPLENVEYKLLLSTDSLFTTFDKYTISNDTTLSMSNSLVEDERYYWKVQAVNSLNDSVWSSGFPYSFVVNELDQSPSNSNLIFPEEERKYPPEDVVFSWSEPEDDYYSIHRYYMFYSKDINFNSADTVENLAVNYHILDSLDSGTYYWKVLAYSYSIGNSVNLPIIKSDSSFSQVKSFIIGESYITSISPNRYVEFAVNDTKQITWNSTNVDYLNIEYSTNGGITWTTITNSFDATIGAYSWLIPDTPSENCKVKITSSSDPSIYKISEEPFSIVPYPIIYVSTNGDDINGDGSSYFPFLTIQKAINSISNLKDSIKVAGGVYVESITLPTHNSGFYLLGGFDDSNWSFDPQNQETIVEPPGTNPIITNIGSNQLVYGITFRNAVEIIHHPSAPSPFDTKFEKCKFISSDWGGFIYATGSLYFESCLFQDLNRGFILNFPSSLNVTNNLLINVNDMVFLGYNNVGSSSFIHNTFIECENCITLAGRTGHKVYNNIFLNSKRGVAYFSSDSLAVIVSDNIFFNNETDILGCSTSFPNIYESPMLSDTANNDFRLSNYSPGIGMGNTDHYSNIDHIGNSRPLPSNSNPDIGAYENELGEPLEFVQAEIIIALEGCFQDTAMIDYLGQNALIPLSQPYSVLPWAYGGVENITAIPDSVIDWVLLELRSDANLLVSQRAAFIKNNGKIVDLDGTSPVLLSVVSEGSYYIVIHHRNHLSIMSSTPITLSRDPVLYDFTTSASQSYGSNALKDLGGGVYGMYAGDANGDGTIDYNDDVIIKWLPNFGLDGYRGEDINMNGTVDYEDDLLNNWLPNFGYSTQVPAITIENSKAIKNKDNIKEEIK